LVLAFGAAVVLAFFFVLVFAIGNPFRVWQGLRGTVSLGKMH
jgi:hypothetical protein